mgnify:CR=1 FL=1
MDLDLGGLEFCLHIAAGIIRWASQSPPNHKRWSLIIFRCFETKATGQVLGTKSCLDFSSTVRCQNYDFSPLISAIKTNETGQYDIWSQVYTKNIDRKPGIQHGLAAVGEESGKNGNK